MNLSCLRRILCEHCKGNRDALNRDCMMGFAESSVTCMWRRILLRKILPDLVLCMTRPTASAAACFADSWKNADGCGVTHQGVPWTSPLV